MENLDDYLRFTVEHNGSDLHVKAGGPAFLRVDGDLKPINALPPLSPKDTEAMAREIMDERTAKEFLARGEAGRTPRRGTAKGRGRGSERCLT